MFENEVDLFGAAVQLREDGAAEPTTRAALGDESVQGRWTVAAFHVEDDRSVHADIWERHPTGDEVLCVLSGAVRVHLRDRGDEPVARLTAGHVYVVPAGRWHRLSVDAPGDLLSITPRPGTTHERLTGDPS